MHKYYMKKFIEWLKTENFMVNMNEKPIKLPTKIKKQAQNIVSKILEPTFFEKNARRATF